MPQRNEEDVRVHRSHSGFTVVQNDILRDPEMSLKAKGLLIYMLSLPPDWDYSVRGLIKVVNPVDENGRTKPIHGQSRDGIYKTLQEIEACGYLIRSQPRNEKSGFMKQVYNVFDRKQRNTSSVPLTDFPDTGKPCTENPTQISTEGNEVLNQTNNSTTTTTIDERSSENEQPTIFSLDEGSWNPDLAVGPHARAAAAEEEDDPETFDDALAATRSTTGGPLPAEMLESIEDEQVRRGFEGLCDRAIKKPRPCALREAVDAYRSALESGITIDEISRAYESYIVRFWADETHVNAKYALRLEQWLKSGGGMTRDLMLIGASSGPHGDARREADASEGSGSKDEADPVVAWLAENDEAFAKAKAENELASRERSRFPIDNGFGDEAMRTLNDPDTPFNATLRKTQQTMDSIYLARKDEVLGLVVAQDTQVPSE